MSVLEKVQNERLGLVERPHIASEAEWQEPQQPSPPVNVEEKWRADLEEAGNAPRFGKKNLTRPNNMLGEAPKNAEEATYHRYGADVPDPARPKHAPFAWDDDSGTVKHQELHKQTSADTTEKWRQNLDVAMEGPRFTKSFGNFHTPKDSCSPVRGSASRRKADVERGSNILAHESAQGKDATGWAHTHTVKPAPYIAHENEWQQNNRLESESIMGRKLASEDYAQRLEAAKPAFNFAKKHGDFHTKAASKVPFLICDTSCLIACCTETPGSPQPAESPRKTTSRAAMNRLSTPKNKTPRASRKPSSQAGNMEARFLSISTMSIALMAYN